jgi:hypothetical protein
LAAAALKAAIFDVDGVPEAYECASSELGLAGEERCH